MRYYNYGGGGGPQYQRPGFFGGGFSFFPPVIKTLIIANIAIFLVMMLGSAYSIGGTSISNILMRYFALMPLGSGYFLPWQLVSYLFLHGGFFHVFFNMFILWMFGMELENMWGSKKFLTFYLVCGVGAGIIHMLVSPLFASAAPTIGASGAVYGVLLAFAMMFPDRMIFLYFLFPVKAKYFVGFLIIFGLFMGMSGTADGIAHFAHLGGAFIAFLYIMADRDRLPLKNLFSGLKRKSGSSGLKYHRGGIEDAKYYDIKEDRQTRKQMKEDPEIDQKRIDEILDKISKSGYQNLTEEEKRILFEASQKLK